MNILLRHQKFRRKDICLNLCSRPLGRKPFTALQWPIPMVIEILVQDPVADLMRAGESSIQMIKFLGNDDAITFAIDKACDFDWH